MTQQQIDKIGEIQSCLNQAYNLLDELMGEMTHDTYDGPGGEWNGFDLNDRKDESIYAKIGEIHEKAEGLAVDMDLILLR
ncbi:MAG: hypothetical protein LIP09_12005 [Bacteroidales bacterium]|nr:hypothetical protein [Bacteroidales bacterium]